MLRISKERKRKYKSIGLSIKEGHWDFKKNQPKPDAPNRELILNIISQKSADYRSKILEYKAEGKDFTISSLLERVEKPVKNKTVADIFIYFMENLRSQKRLSYAASVNQLFNSLLEYDSTKKVGFLFLRNRLYLAQKL